MTHSRLDNERGSLPLALLAVLVVGGLVVTLVATVVTGQRGTRADQAYEQSLHVAEVGLERGATLVASGGWSSDAVRDAPVSIGETSTDGGTYEVTATYDEENEAIIVTSTGSSADKQRTVVGVLQDSPLFPVGAFADRLLNFAGTNHAWSYNSETQDKGPGDWGTGNGSVGSNETLVFAGGAVSNPEGKTTDQAILFNVANNPHNPPSPSRCTHPGGNNCVDVQLEEEEHGLPDNPTYHELEEYCNEAGYNGIWKASEHGGVLPGGTHCFEEVHFDQDVTLALSATEPEAVVFSAGKTSFIKPGTSPRVRVNCTGCEKLSGTLPYPRHLQVFTATSETIPFGNHSRVAALILAPHATCGQSGNSSVNFYGSLVCMNIGNVGNWMFYWDDALAQYRDDEFVFRRWYEQ